jgi:hypothetical protein
MSSILGVDLISYPSNCPPAKIQITPEIAGRIFQCLVAYASASPDQTEAFKQEVSETSGGRGKKQYIIKNGYYGPCGFYICGDEWWVVTTLEDVSPKTEEQLDSANLQLALLRDVIMAELYP